MVRELRIFEFLSFILGEIDVADAGYMPFWVTIVHNFLWCLLVPKYRKSDRAL